MDVRTDRCGPVRWCSSRSNFAGPRAILARFFMSRDGRYAGNAGAISGACVRSLNPKKRRYAGNAGAFFGGYLPGQYPETTKRRYAENAAAFFGIGPFGANPQK